MTKDLFDQRACSNGGCDSPSMPLSEPPLCREHIPDLEIWYEAALVDLRAANQLDAPPIGQGFVHDMYRYALVSKGLPRILYEEFEEREKAGREIAFSFADIIFFIVKAAAAGVIGSLSYDGLKRVIRKVVGSKEARNEALEHLPKVVSEQRYIELAERFQNEVAVETEESIEIRLRRSYRLVMRVDTSEEKANT